MARDWIGLEEMQRLGKLSRGPGVSQSRTSSAKPALRSIPLGETTYASYAKSIIKGRFRIRSYFGEDLFGDPVFDMLLFLFASSEEQREVSISSCCSAAGVPHTTALRWVHAMEARGLVTREPHASDRRMAFLTLTDKAKTSMKAWLTEISSIPLSREM